MNSRVGDDGYYIQTKWTPPGEALKTDGSFKYYSPAWDAKATGEMVNGKMIMQPTKLKSVGFTNNPNIPVLPLANDAVTSENAAYWIIANYGTSEGALKGWETRRGAMTTERVAKSASKVGAKARKAMVVPQGDRPLPPPGSAITEHPTYKKAISEGADHATAVAEARGDIQHEKDMAQMKSNAERAKAVQPIKLIEKPKMPVFAAQVAKRSWKESLKALFGKK